MNEKDQIVEALSEHVIDLTLRYQGQGVGGPHEAVADAIRELLVQAWDEGHTAGSIEATAGLGYQARLVMRNPYIPPGGDSRG